MVRRTDDPEPTDLDDRLGEAIEAYLALAEAGSPPDPEEFAGRHPDLRDDLLAALEGLAMVNGLVGSSGGPGPGGRLETGRRIAGYRVVRELGRGGMGVVYEAVHVGLDRPVALKVLGSHAAPDSSGRRRFLNEARIAAKLHHTHIVPVFDVGQVGALCYYAMQRIEGSGLDRVVRFLRRDRATGAGGGYGTSGVTGYSLWGRVTGAASSFGFGSVGRSGLRATARGSDSETGSWDPDASGLSAAGLASGAGPADSDRDPVDGGGPRRNRETGPPPFKPPRGSAYYRWVAEVGRQAADALGHAHRRGVIHRDVKPSNLLVDGRGLVWVADFGLARRIEDPNASRHETLIGTPRYMSPEQSRCEAVDGRTDLYSLGATLYELLTLRPPFEGRSTAELVEQINRREPPSPRQFDPRLPRDLETIVLKLLSKRPLDRYETAGDLADDLRRFLNREPVRARRISPVGRLWRFARRHPGGTAITTAAAAAVITVTAVAYVRILHERDAAIGARAESQANMRMELYRHADVVRGSNAPDRRSTGLGLLRDAVALGPEPDLKVLLRDLAVEFLVIRDVEARPAVETGPLRGLVFGADGSRLAALTHGGEAGDAFALWDLASRERVAGRLVEPGPGAVGRGPGGGGMRRWGFSASIASAGPCVAVLAPNGRGVRMFDAVTGAIVHDLDMAGRFVEGIAASPDGERIVTVERVFPPRPGGPGSRGGGAAAATGAAAETGPPAPGRFDMTFEVNLWDPDHAETPVASLAKWEANPPGSTGGPSFPIVAVSPDGRTVATARTHKTVVSLWSAESGAPLGQVDTQTELSALALGADNQLATAGNGEVRLWDADAKTPVGVPLTPNQSVVKILRFSPKGPLLAVVGQTGREIELWDTGAHAVISVVKSPDPVADLAFAPDGRTFAAAGDGKTTSVWAVVDPDVRVRFGGFDAMSRSLAFRDDGLLPLGPIQGILRFWDAGRWVHSKSVVSPAAPPPAAAAANPNAGGNANAATPASPEVVSRDRPASFAFDDRGRLLTLEADALRVWDAPPECSKGESLPLPKMPGMFSTMGTVLAASRSGRTVAVGRGDRVLLWDPNEPDRLRPLTPPLPPGPRPPDGDRRPGGGRPGGRPGGGRFWWKALAVGPAGDRLYLADTFGNLHVWRVNGSSATEVNWPDRPRDVWALALSPDGRTLAVGGKPGVTLIDARDGKTLGTLRRPTGESEGQIQVSSLAFAPGGKELAVGTLLGRAELWTVGAEGEASLVLSLPGHRGAVMALAFDPLGRRLASAGSDRTVDVWDLKRFRAEFARLGLAW